MDIRRLDGIDDALGEFIGDEFAQYGIENGIDLNYEDYCFAAEEDGEIIGIITGRAYYNEVHIGDLVIGKNHRRSGVGSALVRIVEETYKDSGYDKISLTTFGFQAPEFYIFLYLLFFCIKPKLLF